MEKEFKINDLVKVEHLEGIYKIVATQAQPRTRKNMTPIKPAEGFDFLVLEVCDPPRFEPFNSVKKEDLEYLEPNET